jgi:hypothetical protein
MVYSLRYIRSGSRILSKGGGYGERGARAYIGSLRAPRSVGFRAKPAGHDAKSGGRSRFAPSIRLCILHTVYNNLYEFQDNAIIHFIRLSNNNGRYVQNPKIVLNTEVIKEY